MKTLKQPFLLLLLVIFTFGCNRNPKPETKTVSQETAATQVADSNLSKATFTIEGMTCKMGCAATIEKKLAALPGVQMATVDFDSKTAQVAYDNQRVDLSLIETTVTNTGAAYSVSNLRKVESFKPTKTCEKNCEKPCCKDKMKADEKCAKDCEKACCKSKDVVAKKHENCTKKCCEKSVSSLLHPTKRFHKFTNVFFNVINRWVQRIIVGFC